MSKRANTKKMYVMPKWQLERALSKLDKDSQTGCWNWTGYRYKSGYGGIKGLDRAIYKAHRLIPFNLGMVITPDMAVDHICKNRSCVNPDHLRLVTYAKNCIENSISPVALNKIKTHCKNGHEFSSENTIHRIEKGRPRRRCKICNRISGRKTDAKRRKSKKCK